MSAELGFDSPSLETPIGNMVVVVFAYLSKQILYELGPFQTVDRTVVRRSLQKI